MNDFYFYTDGMEVGYQGVPLIRQIRIELRRGEILTLIGPNGAGKSTILKSIARQLQLLGGTVFLDGADMMRMKGSTLARKQAAVLTGRTYAELMTCKEVVAAGRYPYTGPIGILGETDRQKVKEALELVHALELQDRPFDQVSDGQRQRVLLARALCQEPEMIVLDEPTSFLDMRHKLEFLQILRGMVRTRNMAVILSLHEIDLAQKVSDRIMCVKGPVIDRVGTPEEIADEAYIRSLYDMEQGSYDAAFGCMELPVPEGKPEVFVIAGGGSGISVYRRLQRSGVPFVTGILQENDIDYQAARHLASEVISAPAFTPVSDDIFRIAADRMLRCGRVLCPLQVFGEQNRTSLKLRDLAEQAGTLEKP